jgi:hypothetical protein
MCGHEHLRRRSGRAVNYECILGDCALAATCRSTRALTRPGGAFLEPGLVLDPQQDRVEQLRGADQRQCQPESDEHEIEKPGEASPARSDGKADIQMPPLRVHIQHFVTIVIVPRTSVD